MTDKKEQLLKKQLTLNLNILDKALDTFNYSFAKCRGIGIKEQYSYEELDKFESLTSRFARISDILTQKILKNVFLLIRENANTFMDRAHLAEKIEMIDSAEELKAVRDLRNEIAHEYCMEDVSEIFESVLKYSSVLLKTIDKVKKYIELKQLTVPEAE